MDRLDCALDDIIKSKPRRPKTDGRKKNKAPAKSAGGQLLC